MIQAIWEFADGLTFLVPFLMKKRKLVLEEET
jgi:hypothetical protein